MKRNINARQHNITVEKAVSEFLHHLKDRGLTLHTLCNYENTFKDFFQGEGTAFIKDFFKDPTAHIKTVQKADIEAYKARKISERISPTSINRRLKRLQRLFDYAVRHGYMDKLGIELLEGEKD